MGFFIYIYIHITSGWYRYLQWLIEDQDSTDTQFHTLYALSLAKTALESLETDVSLHAVNKSIKGQNNFIIGRDSLSENPVRERLQFFLHSSDLYDAEEVLELIEGSELWLEKVMCYSYNSTFLQSTYWCLSCGIILIEMSSYFALFG